MRMNDEIKQTRWSIGQVAKLVKVNTSCIRYWQSEGLIKDPDRINARKERYYSIKNLVEIIQAVYLIKTMKLKIDGAKRVKKIGIAEDIIELHLNAT